MLRHNCLHTSAAYETFTSCAHRHLAVEQTVAMLFPNPKQCLTPQFASAKSAVRDMAAGADFFDQ